MEKIEKIISLHDVCKNSVISFKNIFRCAPEICTFAPGRVNLIGEHTDYHDGFVFPMALPLVTLIVGSKSDSDKCRIITICDGIDEPIEIEIETSDITSLKPGIPKWANYVKGVIAMHPEKGNIPSFNAFITTTVPCGSGLSSSAALEVSMFAFLDELLGIVRSDFEGKKFRALRCQKAEHEFANVPCGIMDQFVSSIASSEYALLIDCRSLDAKLAKISSKKVAILITNSNVKHDLSSGEYALRRSECEVIKDWMKKSHLRDASMEDLFNSKDMVNDICYRRGRHVITENLRCLWAFECLEDNNYTEFGKLMTASHNSLRDDYEVSCPELDQLVSLALEVKGVFGSRMTGGGFGGCTVTLLDKNVVNDVVKHISKGYKGQPTFYLCTASPGAGVIDLKHF